jgi:hypothetical protein
MLHHHRTLMLVFIEFFGTGNQLNNFENVPWNDFANIRAI